MARYLGRNMSRFAEADMVRGAGGANQNQTVQSQIQEQAQILANQMIAEMQLAEETAALGRIYTNFASGDIRGEYEEVVQKDYLLETQVVL